MTAIDLSALRAALDAATHGKWFIAGVGRIACQTHGVIVECAVYYRAGEADQEANAAYIVAAQPQNITRILDAYAEMERALREANRLCRSMHAIASRRGVGTNWDAFITFLEKELKAQHAIMYPAEATTAEGQGR